MTGAGCHLGSEQSSARTRTQTRLMWGIGTSDRLGALNDPNARCPQLPHFQVPFVGQEPGAPHCLKARCPSLPDSRVPVAARMPGALNSSSSGYRSLLDSWMSTLPDDGRRSILRRSKSVQPSEGSQRNTTLVSHNRSQTGSSAGCPQQPHTPVPFAASESRCPQLPPF